MGPVLLVGAFTPLGWGILAGAIVWAVGALLVAFYGSGKDYPPLPLLLCGLFLGWPLVLLGVVIGDHAKSRA